MAFAIVGVNANAQENTSTDETKTERRIYMPTGVSCIDGPRFEIVIPRNNNTPYLRLDKETGDVLQLRQSLGSKNYAKAIEREPSEYDIRKEGQNNYQIVAESPFHIYLMNINTGLIWNIATNPSSAIRRQYSGFWKSGEVVLSGEIRFYRTKRL